MEQMGFPFNTPECKKESFTLTVNKIVLIRKGRCTNFVSGLLLVKLGCGMFWLKGPVTSKISTVQSKAQSRYSTLSCTLNSGGSQTKLYKLNSLINQIWLFDVRSSLIQIKHVRTRQGQSNSIDLGLSTECLDQTFSTLLLAEVSL